MFGEYVELGLDGLEDLESVRDRGLVPYVRGLALVSWTTRGHTGQGQQSDGMRGKRLPSKVLCFVILFESFSYRLKEQFRTNCRLSDNHSLA